MIETRLLQYFLAIAREENITKAAESLFITQSTLSKQMMDLEQQLGKQLFTRGKRKITLTDEGVYLRNRANEIIALIENTESALHTDSQHLCGDITIGCGETIVMDYIAELFSSFHEQYPEVKFHTYSGDADAVLERLDKGLIDMGLLLGPLRQEKYDYLNLHKKDCFGLLMPESCELSKQEYINIDQFGTDESVLNVTATYSLIHNATYLVERGIGYALCLDKLVNTNGRNLTFRPISPELSVNLYVVTKKYQAFSPAAKTFLDLLKQSIESTLPKE